MHAYVIKDTVSLKHLEAVKSCIIDSNFEQTLTPQLCLGLGLGVVAVHDHEDILATDPGLNTVSIRARNECYLKVHLPWGQCSFRIVS